MTTLTRKLSKFIFVISWLTVYGTNIWTFANQEMSSIHKIYDASPLMKTTRPSRLAGGPVNVEVGMYISSVSNIDPSNQKFDVDMILHQNWHDSRLNFTEQLNTNYTLTINDEDLIKKVWIPDLFISNAKSTNYQSRVDNRGLAQALRVMSGGNVQYTNRLTLDVHCEMDLTMFPADEQICKIVIQSYSQKDDQIQLSWENSDCPVQLEHEHRDLHFYMESMCPKVATKTRHYGNGRFSVLESYVKFKRYSSSYVLTVYIPAAIIVLLSIASFWIRPNLASARVALGITSVLCEIVIMIGALNAYSLTSYMKGLDLYTTVCFFFTIGVALEYAAVYINNRNKYFDRKQQENIVDEQEDIRELQALARGTTVRPTSTPSSNPKPELGYVNSVSTGFPLRNIPHRSFQAIFDPNLPPDNRPNYRRQPKMAEQEIRAKERQTIIDTISSIDSVCRVLFPVVFVIFNIFYFLWILQVI